MDTLLICDAGNSRVVEITAGGEFLRAIAFERYSHLYGIAYCGTKDLIAVSLITRSAKAVVLLQYDSGARKFEVTASFGSEGELPSNPRGVTFTIDGCHLLVVDSGDNRVSKFSATSGAFIAHVVTKPANGISKPWDVLQCEDGSIVVTQAFSVGGSVVCVGADGLTAQEIIIPSTTGGAILTPYSPSYCAPLNGVVVKTHEGAFLLRDAWFASSRHAWLSALSCS
jgi:hypothetical protein